MKIIEIKTSEIGGHDNQDFHGVLPEGWAVIPDTMAIPDTFPFVNITVKDGVVTSMTENQEAYDAAVAAAEEAETEAAPTQLDILEAQVTYTAMMTDTLLESEE